MRRFTSEHSVTMNSAAPNGEPPRRISDPIRKMLENSLPPGFGEALRRGALAYTAFLYQFL
jgi:hypothetical protein